VSKKVKVLIATVLISVVLLIFGILTGDVGIIGNMILMSTFIIFVPQMILTYIQYKRLKEMEMRFPDFLRDLVESIKAGLPLHKAIIIAGDTNYGPLSDEIKKMSNQLTWNVPVISVLEQLKKRMRKSPELEKTIRIIIETYKSGGDTDKILDSLSTTLNTLHETQKERESMLKQYVVAMYAISFVFIFIVVAINKLMVPIFENLGGATSSTSPIGLLGSSPCAPCQFQKGLQCTPCNIYSLICSILRTNTTDVGCYYLGLFFSMSFIQAIFSGLVAGQIGEGNVRAGIKHSLILLMITCGTFFILVRIGLLGTI
jgi:flagellar protein FlaJ